jgi:Protein of unknown function (DUF1778).
MAEKKTERIEIRIEPKIKAELQECADLDHRKLSAYCARILTDRVNKIFRS